MSFNTLISPEDLASHSEFRVFDCRHELSDPAAGATAYARSHVPGALHAPMDTALSGLKTGRNGRHPLPDPAAFIRWLGRCGVGPDDQVVAYDGGDGAFAARLWWMLRAIGHESVAVLDGGLALWRAQQRPETTEVPAIAPRAYASTRPAPSDWSRDMLVDVTAVEANLATPSFTVLDARAENRYAGRDETIDPVGGHIPGARNRPYAMNIAGGRFKSPDALLKDFTGVLPGVSPKDVVHQCGSGVTACHNLLAMEVAGLPGSRVYAGSWSEWCSDSSRPVVTGSEPGGQGVLRG